ncbi:MAG TPA: DUF4097 family beta strand repeat-containing protein [Sedimentisphaerales bacterium]|nr:DUF4097 family beta strand repeat-containing protein [Sedimentisphaerales bacterium]
MRKHFLINLCLVVSLCLLTAFSSCKDIDSLFRAEHQRTEHVSVPIAGVAGLNVESDVGSITVTGADVTDCNVTAEITVKAQTKEKARKLAEEVKIKLESSGDTLTIKAVRPAELKKRALVVDFKIIAPRHMKLDCSTGVGTVTVSDIEGRIEASVNVGSIVCHMVVAELDLSSNVGSVTVKYADAAPAACNANITTNVGSIEFTAPPELSAQVSVSTNIGSVKTARPITVVGKVGKSIKGTIGTGEGKVLLKTNVGSIEIN